MRRLLRWAIWITALLLAIVLVLVILIATFDWNRARPWIAERVSASLHRSFSIDGDLSVHWQRMLLDDATRSWIPWPQINAKAITLGNPDWAESEHMVRIDEVDFAVSPWSLLARKLHVPAIRVSGADVDIERLADARANWIFDLAASAGPSWDFELGDVVLDRGKIAVNDAIERVKIDIEIEPLEKSIAFADILRQQETESRSESATTIGEGGARKFREAATASQKKRKLERESPSNYEFAWRATGSFRGSTLDGRGKSGGILALHSDEEPFPVQARLHLGNTRIAFVGTLTDPASLDALDMRLWLSGKSMSDLYPLTGVTLPDTPPFATEGHLSGELKDGANVFRYEEFTGRVGGSDLAGSVTYTEGEPRAKLSGAVHSDLLQFADLAPLVGAGPAASKAATSEASVAKKASSAGKLLPTAEFRTDRWNAMDADIEFTGKRVVHTAELPIDAVEANIELSGGRLQLKPLRFGLAGGRVDSTIHLDGTRKPMSGQIDLRLARLKLKELFPAFESMQTSFGEINGSAALSAKGNSIAALLGASNGEIKLLINDGAISKSLLETAGLNIANIVIARMFGDKDVKIHCAASHFVVTDGIVDSKLFVFDTEDALINISGTANFSKETFDFDVQPHTKGLRIFSLRSPLYVRGTFEKPDVGVKKGPLILRGGGALLLGIFAAPAAALIPLIAPSHGEPNRCGDLLAGMRGKAKAS
jgi:uncharacterized protein involved in outer membrane biogenesis